MLKWKTSCLHLQIFVTSVWYSADMSDIENFFLHYICISIDPQKSQTVVHICSELFFCDGITQQACFCQRKLTENVFPCCISFKICNNHIMSNPDYFYLHSDLLCYVIPAACLKTTLITQQCTTVTRWKFSIDCYPCSEAARLIKFRENVTQQTGPAGIWSLCVKQPDWNENKAAATRWNMLL